MIGGHPNRINRGVAAVPLHAGNVVGIGLQNPRLICFKGQLLQRRPLLEPDPTLREFSLNLSGSFRHQQRRWRALIHRRRSIWKDAETTHRLAPGRSLLTIIDPKSPGTLTLVGVGPGNPSLLTLAAVHAIETSDVIAYPVARPGSSKHGRPHCRPVDPRRPHVFAPALPDGGWG